ncbi:hypothetical protein KCU65_g5750, partial [Aureobasidium melanogenum]
MQAEADVQTGAGYEQWSRSGSAYPSLGGVTRIRRCQEIDFDLEDSTPDPTIAPNNYTNYNQQAAIDAVVADILGDPLPQRRAALTPRDMYDTAPGGYSSIVVSSSAALSAPLNCNGANTFIGSKLFTSGPFDESLCAAACTAQSAYNLKHPLASGLPKLCQYYNTYVLLKDGVSRGQHCTLYTQAWDGSYATNKGQWRGTSVVTSIETDYTTEVVYATSYTTDVPVVTTTLTAMHKRTLQTPGSASTWSPSRLPNACSAVATGSITTTVTTVAAMPLSTLFTTQMATIVSTMTTAAVLSSTSTHTIIASPQAAPSGNVINPSSEDGTDDNDYGPGQTKSAHIPVITFPSILAQVELSHPGSEPQIFQGYRVFCPNFMRFHSYNLMRSRTGAPLWRCWPVAGAPANLRTTAQEFLEKRLEGSPWLSPKYARRECDHTIQALENASFDTADQEAWRILNSGKTISSEYLPESEHDTTYAVTMSDGNNYLAKVLKPSNKPRHLTIASDESTMRFTEWRATQLPMGDTQPLDAYRYYQLHLEISNGLDILKAE